MCYLQRRDYDLIQSKIALKSDDKILISYANLLNELNQELPKGIKVMIMPRESEFNLLLLNDNHQEIINQLRDLVIGSGYGNTTEYAYKSSFVFYNQGMGVVISYDDYSLSTNNSYQLKRRLNNEFEKMEVLVRMYNHKLN